MKEIVSSKNLIPFLNERNKTNLKYSEGGVIERKEAIVNEVKTLDEKEGTVWCKITTNDVDRVGDMVIPSGIDTSEFSKIPSVFINHDYSKLPIATCTEMIHKDNCIEAKIKFALDIPDSKDVFDRIKTGLLKGISIGFESMNHVVKGTKEFVDTVKSMNLEANDKLKRIFLSWKLYEFSICGAPANINCTTKSTTKSTESIPVVKEEPKDGTTQEAEQETEQEKEPEKKNNSDEVKIEMEDHKELVARLKTDGYTDEEITSMFEMIVQDELREDPDFYKEETEEMEKADSDTEEEGEDQEEEAEEEAEENEDKDIDLDIILKPFPSFHSARQKPPSAFIKGSFRYLKDKGGSGIDFIVGKLKGKTTTTIQSIRFAKDKHTVEEAKAWLKKHGYKTGVVAAKGSKSFFNVIRTKEDIDEYIKKAVQAKLSGKLEIDW